MSYRNANLGHHWIGLATGYAEIFNTYFSKRLRSFQVEKTNPDWYRIAVSEKKLEKGVDFCLVLLSLNPNQAKRLMMDTLKGGAILSFLKRKLSAVQTENRNKKMTAPLIIQELAKINPSHARRFAGWVEAFHL